MANICNCATYGSAHLCQVHTQADYEAAKQTEKADVAIEALQIYITTVLISHQRKDISGCICGWSELGKSFPGHQADEILIALGLKSP